MANSPESRGSSGLVNGVIIAATLTTGLYVVAEFGPAIKRFATHLPDIADASTMPASDIGGRTQWNFSSRGIAADGIGNMNNGATIGAEGALNICNTATLPTVPRLGQVRLGVGSSNIIEGHGAISPRNSTDGRSCGLVGRAGIRIGGDRLK